VAIAYIGLGSNVGARGASLDSALLALIRHGRLLRTSRRYVSAPIGYLEQSSFLNQVAELDTRLSPRELLASLKAIEREVGRTASFRNGPREIDMDILLYDDVMMKEADLTLPHPRMLERAFVLRPLAELIEKVAGRSMQEWLAQVAAQHAEPLAPGQGDVA
jgi:2-amino-4-hydroxy-6-hydroxymethyldihydropteridine diphosphokinase